MDWEAVDRALTPIARGETIFAAQRDGDQTSGYIHFSAEGSTLPLDRVNQLGGARAAWSP